MRRGIFLLLVAAVLAVAAPGRVLGGDDEARVLVPIESYLPADTGLFLSLPDSSVLQKVLDGLGDTRPALVSRLAGDGEGPVDAESLGVLLEIVNAATDGPVTFSLHRQVVQGRARTEFLVTATSRRKGPHLYTAGEKLLRGFFAPRNADFHRTEILQGIEVDHLSGKDFHLYLARARGFLIFASSPLLMGRVLTGMQNPPAKPLGSDAAYVQGRAILLDLTKVERAGWLHLRDASLLPGLAPLGIESATGVLAPLKEGFGEMLLVKSRPGGVLANLRGDRAVPGAWAKAPAGACWVGAALRPAGVRGFLLSVLGEGYAPFLGDLTDTVQGDVEALLYPGGAPVVRLVLEPGAKPGGTFAMLSGMTRRAGDVLLLSADAERLAKAAAGESKSFGEAKGAAFAGPVAGILRGLGRAGSPATGTTTWSIERASAGQGGTEAVLSADAGVIGPIQAVIGALFR